MLLKKIIGNCGNFGQEEIEKISHDENNPGDLYFCLSSSEEKCKKNCQTAFDKGAKVIVCEKKLDLPNALCVKEARKLFARSCANFYGHAADKLKIVGVTGTNGKTTTTHMIAEILKRNGKSCGVIGTNGVFYAGRRFDCPLTTPDADFLHKTFRDMLSAGVQYVAMEVSAHAIVQDRVDGIKFDLGVLTNVTQDHLDYFKTLENYKNAKFSFFTPQHIKKAIVCSDDRACLELLQNCKVPAISYGIKNPSDCFAMDLCCTTSGTSFVANVCDKVLKIKTNFVGDYNVQNALAAFAVCSEFGLDERQLANGLSYMLPVEGRFNVINFSGKNVVIDFAHSPDSLKKVLKLCRTLTDQEIFVIFGCGGNRDKDKRHKMGQIAEKYADHVCLTDDNPRFENSLDIISDIEKGMTKPHDVQRDRAKAIESTISKAKPGDIVLIAGKGAEKFQVVGDRKIPYNDYDTVYGIFKDKDPNKFRGKEYGN